MAACFPLNPNPDPPTIAKHILKCSGSRLPKHRELVLSLASANIQVVNFQPDFVFASCLIKDTKKLFSPPAALFWGSKRNSAVI